MTKLQCQRLVYDFADQNNIPHRFNNETKLAGDDWMYNFMSKYNFSIRKPEATSVGRLMAFNKVNVDLFFNKLKEIRLVKNYSACQIYNIDESGISSVPTKLPKVISPTGARRVAKIVSAERGKNVTAVLGINAVGMYIPPFLIFSRKRMDKQLAEGTPPGTVAIGNESGWMTSESFLLYLEHFSKYVKSTSENPILLLLDNHSSHVSLQAINFCRTNHITMLGFPPHTTHKLQPLDVAVFGPLKTYYSQACDSFMVNYPGRKITDYDIGKLFNEAYNRTANVGNAVNGFKACGIEPFNPHVFSDSDFLSAAVTERPLVEEQLPNNDHTLELDQNEENTPISCYRNEENIPKTSQKNEENTPIPSQTHIESTSIISSQRNEDLKIPAKLPDLPVADRPKSTRRPRAEMPSLEITSSPVKSILEMKIKKKLISEQQKQERLNKRKLNKLMKENKSKKSGNEKRQYVVTDHEDSADDECIYCQEPYRNDVRGEAWIKCLRCARWAHELCSGVDCWKTYTCEFCNKD